jgi:signal transduction histidine kinase
VDAELANKAEADADRLAHDGPGGGYAGPGGPRPSDDGPETGFVFDPGGYFFAITDENSEIYECTDGITTTDLASPAVLETALDEGSATVQVTSAAGDTQRIYVLPAEVEGGEQVFLQIGRSIEAELDTLQELRTILMAVVALSMVPAMVGGYMLSGRVLRPIKTAVDSQRTFIADASHELKTPIAVVRTNAELLERHIASPKGITEADRESVEDILSETERLGRMVDQMLTLAQADAGRVTMELDEDVELGEIVDEVGRSMRALAEQRGVELRTERNPRVEVRGDRARLRELLVILLDNAIKYTDRGGRIELTLRRKGRHGEILVTDTGHGIPADALAHIFDRFYRVDKARSRDEGGTGLGLAIAKHIVDAHGGTIGITSTPGRGTRVTVELRARGRQEAPAQVADPA